MLGKLIYIAHEFLFAHYQTSPTDEFDNARIENRAQLYQRIGIVYSRYPIIDTYLFYLSDPQYLRLTEIP